MPSPVSEHADGTAFALQVEVKALQETFHGALSLGRRWRPLRSVAMQRSDARSYKSLSTKGQDDQLPLWKAIQVALSRVLPPVPK